jgi:hypothetical protein
MVFTSQQTQVLWEVSASTQPTFPVSPTYTHMLWERPS